MSKVLAALIVAAVVRTLADFNIPIIVNLTGADITVVPFKGASPAITALIA